MLLVLTPLGILAAGSAWGEWMASDYSNPAARSQIAAASLHQAPPARVPEGLARLSAGLDGAVRALCAALHPQRELRIYAFGDVRRGADRAGCWHWRRAGERLPHGGGFIERNIKGLHAAPWSARFTRNELGVGRRPAAGDRPAREGGGPVRADPAAALASRLWVLAAILAVAGIGSRLFADFAAHAGIAGVAGRLRVQRRDRHARAVSYARRGAAALPDLVGRSLRRASAPRPFWCCAWRRRPRLRCC